MKRLTKPQIDQAIAESLGWTKIQPMVKDGNVIALIGAPPIPEKIQGVRTSQDTDEPVLGMVPCYTGYISNAFPLFLAGIEHAGTGSITGDMEEWEAGGLVQCCIGDFTTWFHPPALAISLAFLSAVLGEPVSLEGHAMGTWRDQPMTEAEQLEEALNGRR